MFYAVAAVVHVFVFIVVSYAAGHGKECVTEMVRVESAYSPLSATAVVKAPPRGKGVCILACQVRLSCFCCFPAQLKVGVERLTQGTEKFLPRKVCAFLLWQQVSEGNCRSPALPGQRSMTRSFKRLPRCNFQN